MPVEINGQKYYRTEEVCAQTGISRTTLFRWLRQPVLSRAYKDNRGWRLFTENDLKTIHAHASRIEVREIMIEDRSK
ncbi:MerR HTH family regulatory protein [Dehalogenimonas formicexedens]|uniref:MerR HTH family regulatory protein n=2 Tax=Dehalogenimonas TaxID=670486 RepID=A0A1P8F5Y4_9CHLR|nr:MerR HTH family regulatory protein [Dehalogenimonas formicexedens]KTB49317.1 MerR HTH family regulatory protein [Dehalogenimonas alkenigignens]